MQLRHIEALDNRSGIVLGFAGALVALAGGGHIVTSIGRALAATAGLFALLGLIPRWLPQQSASASFLTETFGPIP